MNKLIRILLALLVAAWIPASLAQTSFATANRAVQIYQAREANAALMHQYEWNSRTEIISQGQVKDIRIDLVSYGPFGQLQRTVINDQPASGGPIMPTPFGFLRRAIAEDKKKEMQEYLMGLQGCSSSTRCPRPRRSSTSSRRRLPADRTPTGLFQMTGYSVVQPGDNLTLWVNPWTKHLRQMQVNTTFQGNAVADDRDLPDAPRSGLNYAAFAEATVPAKQLSVQVQNYNFARLGY